MKVSFRGMIALFAVGMMMTMGITGCAIRDYCKDSTDCEGGNTKDEKACRAQLKGQRSAAAKYGCRSEFNEMMACEADNGECVSGSYDTNNECSSESTALWECIQDESAYYDQY
jgi:hypothetical protein